ncbi:hypothetical protein BFG52_03255 [Acinetobacter larvae]|uniref:Glucosamine inositolphosphorylceramide transferase 1 N-terminal domain-containing protein n=2 Tax=Acinetobacter larvae TaxID=1789224 RepID=A0A1B2LWZ9_9GAMM|nr:hypothetical protein BFG52_03255 [Acinetobacter larvae]
MRYLLKKWYKFQQKRQARQYHSHWYIRFVFLDRPFNSLEQLKDSFEIHSPHKFTFADCFYAEHNHRHFIFFEEVDAQHPVGFLSVLEIFQDGRYTEPTPILKCDYHLSYPCIFKIESDWYMIPESASNKNIELWKCTEFPYHWQKHSDLMTNIEAVDSTPFFYNGLWYLFTSTRRGCKKFGDRLDIFYTKDILNPNWHEHPKNPVCRGQQQYRMAGNIFNYQGKLVRPSQDSLKRYGGHIELKEITLLTPDDYQETLLDTILPNWDSRDDGCHSIDVNNQVVVIDAIRLTKK